MEIHDTNESSIRQKRIKDSSRIGGEKTKMSEMSADVGEGSVLTGGTEAVSISRHSAPSFGGSLTSRSVRAVCQLW